ncbi:MAG: hypothetical protein AAFP19_21075 [Bacteroidota bacterium]
MKTILPTTKELLDAMKDLDILSKFNDHHLDDRFYAAQSSFPYKQDLIWEIIAASDRCYWSDAESGKYPPDYEVLLKDILSSFVPEQTDYSIKLDEEQGESKIQRLRLSLSMGEIQTDATLANHGDYYDVESVQKLLNQGLSFKKGQSIYSIETDDQSFCFMLLDLKAMRQLFERYDFEWRDAYFKRLLTSDWSTSFYGDAAHKIQKPQLHPKELIDILHNSQEVSDDQIRQLCDQYQNDPSKGIVTFYEQVLVSQYKGAAVAAKRVLVNRFKYTGQEIHGLIMERLFEPNKTASLPNLIAQIHDWKIVILPKLSKILGLLDQIEAEDPQLDYDRYEWSLLLLGYKDKGLYKKLMERIKSSDHTLVRKICIDALNLVTFVYSYFFLSSKREKITQLYSALIKEDHKKNYTASILPYFQLLGTTAQTQSLIEVFSATHQKMDTLSKGQFLKIINRSMYLNGYESSFEPLLVQIWESHQVFENYVIPGLRLSKTPRVQQKLEKVKKEKRESAIDPFAYDLRQAKKEQEDLVKSIQSWKNLIDKKHGR